MFVLELSLAGILPFIFYICFIVPSMGYDTNPTSPMTIGKSILSMGFICIFTIVPAFIEVKLVKDQKEVATDDFVVAVDSLLYDDPIDDPTYYYDDDYYTGALISTVKSVGKSF